ncbi:MAG: hypothetical protein KIS92_16535 [Planctomycetota bacterium]|nr:hypothetical protein [Planctomycetota bacterium]
MKLWFLMPLLALSPLARAADGLAPEHKDEAAAALKQEQAGLYKKIEWQADLAAARKKAAERNKPIFVVLVVGHLGRKGAAEC